MARIQRDTHNGFAPDAGPGAAGGGPGGPERRRPGELLDDWDGAQGVDSAPAAYFNAVWRHLLRLTFTTSCPRAPGRAAATAGTRWSRGCSTARTTRGGTTRRPTGAPRAATTSCARRWPTAYDELAGRLGADVKAWRWGDLHTLTLTNPTFGTSGHRADRVAVQPGPAAASGGERRRSTPPAGTPRRATRSTRCPSMRMIVDLADLDRSRWINLTGASGHAFHANYWDQAPLLGQGRDCCRCTRRRTRSRRPPCTPCASRPDHRARSRLLRARHGHTPAVGPGVECLRHRTGARGYPPSSRFASRSKGLYEAWSPQTSTEASIASR